MGDSDEEYDRRRGRDKFRRERDDYAGRREERRREPWDDSRNRDSWSSRNRERSRDMYRDYERGRRDRYSPSRHDVSPPMKRMRRDWDDAPYGYDMPYGGGGGGGGGGGPPGPPHGWGPGPGDMPPPQQHYPGHRGQEPDFPTQPPMMTFKQFLGQQDDTISDQDAVKKYNEYKIDFSRQQINDFFLQHKEEEWFKAKYHPEECDKRREEMMGALKFRARVFTQLMEMGKVDSCSVDIEKTDNLVKLLDAAIILLEGGNEQDLKVLEMPPEKLEEGRRSRPNSESQTPDKGASDDGSRREDRQKSDNQEPVKLNMNPDQEELQKKAEEFSKQDKEEGEMSEKRDKKKKRHRDKTEYSYESGSESESGSDSESEPAPPGVEDEPAPPGTGEQAPGTDTKEEKQGEEKGVSESGVEEGEEKEEADTRPRPLHQTLSIFLRNLAPTITKQEVEAMCKRYPGFMRVALQDPQPERRWFRRGWVTFERNVNIKDICWNLNNIRLRDCEMGAIVNRDIKQRIRPINGITCHRAIMRQDIKNTAKIIQVLDRKWGLWEDGDEKGDKEKESFGLVSKNPVLKNITDYLVEEGSYEEEELLGEEALEEKKDGQNGEITAERDEKVMKVLDKMILYLRVVFSVDYYSGAEYPQEDEMPHRCGIMHARAAMPINKLTQSDISEWVNNFEQKIKHLLEMKGQLEEEEAGKLGKKDPDIEVEKFVNANTQELGKDKWLCPLSGKKFKGPEFVRKHILNKHGEKIDEVKQEVAFFNNYLLDTKRPQLPEHPANRQGGMPMPPGRDNYNMPPGGGYGPPQQGVMAYNQPRPPMMGYQGGPPPQYQSPNYGGRREEPYRQDPYRRPQLSARSRLGDRPQGRSNYSRPNDRQVGLSRSRESRSIIEYRDLDAPDDVDIF